MEPAKRRGGIGKESMRNRDELEIDEKSWRNYEGDRNRGEFRKKLTRNL